jgi:hypothetical protein
VIDIPVRRLPNVFWPVSDMRIAMASGPASFPTV